jgi:hypothetical protein
MVWHAPDNRRPPELNYTPLLLFLQKKNRSVLVARVGPLRFPTSGIVNIFPRLGNQNKAGISAA